MEIDLDSNTDMNKKIIQNLDIGWRFLENDTKDWFEAIVPGCVHLDLFNNRLIQDPFYGTNEKRSSVDIR